MRLNLSVTRRRLTSRKAGGGGSILRALPLAVLLPIAAGVSTDVLEAYHAGRDLIAGRATMRMLPSTKITGDGGICGTEPCWLGKNSRESIDLRAPGERQPRTSKDSYAATLVEGTTQHMNWKGSKGDLIDERILRVIRLLSPDAYFFARERAKDYEVVVAPSILSPSVLPRGVPPAELVIVWRRVGLSFLLHRIDRDLCPSWDECKLGEPTLSVIGGWGRYSVSCGVVISITAVGKFLKGKVRSDDAIK